jgi:murein DD-endopeptidase MepM/ murein hydrolase activator NlpD
MFGGMRTTWVFGLVVAALSSTLGDGCRPKPTNPYESASPEAIAGWKRVRIPLPAGTRFVISQGAFGRDTHSQSGIQHRWDFDVPYGTPVVAVEAGTVLAVPDVHVGGGCDAKFGEGRISLMIEQADGTVAQYVHVEGQVLVGQRVTKGDVVAVTGNIGFHCTPQLDFLVYRSRYTLYDSPQRESIALRFEGLPRELALEGFSGTVPSP